VHHFLHLDHLPPALHLNLYPGHNCATYRPDDPATAPEQLLTAYWKQCQPGKFIKTRSQNQQSGIAACTHRLSFDAFSANTLFDRRLLLNKFDCNVVNPAW
jgi:hypothetical protein